jgi:hypothetical protein
MKENNKAEVFSLQGIKIEQFAIFEENFKEAQKANIATSIQFALNPADLIIVVFFQIEFKQEDIVLLKLVLSSHFKFEKASWNKFENKENTQIIVPKEILAHLSAISASTARGVLFAKTEGSQLSRFIVPLINVAAMIPEDATFEKNNT